VRRDLPVSIKSPLEAGSLGVRADLFPGISPIRGIVRGALVWKGLSDVPVRERDVCLEVSLDGHIHVDGAKDAHVRPDGDNAGDSEGGTEVLHAEKLNVPGGVRLSIPARLG